MRYNGGYGPRPASIYITDQFFAVLISRISRPSSRVRPQSKKKEEEEEEFVIYLSLGFHIIYPFWIFTIAEFSHV